MATPKPDTLREKSLLTTFGICNSNFNKNENKKNQTSFSNNLLDTKDVKFHSLGYKGPMIMSKHKVAIK